MDFNDDAITVSMKETTKDKVSLNGKVKTFELPTNYYKFLKSNSYSRWKKSPKRAGCFNVCGTSTNLCAIEFEKTDRIESRSDYMSFSSEKEVNEFFQSIFKTHCVVFPQNQTLNWDEWLLVASALNPSLKQV